MGTWGNKLYEDDDAQAARDAYKDLLAKGLEGPMATDRFLKVWKTSLNDSDDGPVVWFALAETQLTLGHLEDRVRDKAIALIDNGSSLDRWREQGPKAVAARKRVLAALRKRLLAGQLARKAVKSKQPVRKAAEAKQAAGRAAEAEPPSSLAGWKRGELFAYRLRSGKSVVLCVDEVKDAIHVYISALDWIGDKLPTTEAIECLPRKTLPYTHWKGAGCYTSWRMIESRKREVPFDRMNRLRVQIKPAPQPERYKVVKFWNGFDRALEEFFGWT